MKIFHIELAKTGTSLSGGEKCMVEIIHYFSRKKLINIIVTTDNGKELYEKLDLKESEYIQYITINSFWTESRFHIFISYILRLFFFGKYKKDIVASIDKDNDVLMCHSDFFPNTISSWELSKYFHKKTFYWFHMKAPELFHGYKGEFTKEFSFPSVSLVHYRLNQLLFFILSKNGMTIIINPYYQYLFKGRDVYTVSRFAAGVAHVHVSEKMYDIAFMGRFHRQKGLLDVPDILAKVREKKPDVQLLLIGDGDQKLKKKFFTKIHTLNLEKNVDYRGAINSSERYELLAKSKTFLFPSYYESYGIVALEAMSCGLPVIAYTLPVFAVFKQGMIQVPIKDTTAASEQLAKLLSDDVYLAKSAAEAEAYADTFSWDSTGEEIYQLIMAA